MQGGTVLWRSAPLTCPCLEGFVKPRKNAIRSTGTCEWKLDLSHMRDPFSLHEDGAL